MFGGHVWNIRSSEPWNCFRSGRCSHWDGPCCCVDAFWLDGRPSAYRVEMFYVSIYLSYMWAHVLLVFAFFCFWIDHWMIICQMHIHCTLLCCGLGMAIRSFLVTTPCPYLTQRFQNNGSQPRAPLKHFVKCQFGTETGWVLFLV